MPTSSFNLSGFKSTLFQRGVLKNNLFLVNFNVPSCLQGGYGVGNKTLFYYTQATELPGITFAAADTVRRYGYGPTQKFPFLPVFSDLSMSFLMDNAGENRKFFDNWMQGIVGFYEPDGIPNATNQVNGFNAYELEYKDNYVVDMNITVYNEVTNSILIYTLRDAFPISVGQSTLSWNNQNEILSVPITFSYTDWYSNSLVPSTDLSNTKGQLNYSLLSNYYQSSIPLVSTINPVINPNNLQQILHVINNGAL